MPHTLTPVSTFSSTITVPSDGDPVNAAGLETFVQACVNRSQFLKDTYLNGAGGSYAPGSAIQITGAGLIIGGAGLLCSSAAVFAGGMAATGGIVVDTFLASGGATFSTGGTVTFNVPVTLNTIMSRGAGGQIKKRIIQGANADTTYDVSVDHVFVPHAGISADRTYKVSSTNAVGGNASSAVQVSTIKFSTGEQTNKLVIKRDCDNTTIIELKYNSGFDNVVELYFDGFNWQRLCSYWMF